MLSSLSKKTYAPSTYSTTTTHSSNPLLTSSSGEATTIKTKRTTKAWKKTKKFLASIGEPPTAEYDRQQAAKGEPSPNRQKNLVHMDYGPYNRGPMFGGRT